MNIEKEISKINELYSKGHLDIEKTQMEAITMLFNENNYIKQRINDIIKDYLPDDEICKSCDIFDVNGIEIKEELKKIIGR